MFPARRLFPPVFLRRGTIALAGQEAAVPRGPNAMHGAFSGPGPGKTGGP